MSGTLLVDRDVATEAELAAAVVDTLLREDYAGLAGRVRVTGAGTVLDWPGGPVLPLRADGFLATVVGGQVIIEGGRPTGARPGRLIRGPLAHPAP